MSLSQYAHPEVLVDTQWVVAHLSDPKLRLVQTDMTPQAYNTGHIPGTVFWNASDLLLPDQRTNFDRVAMVFYPTPRRNGTWWTHSRCSAY